MDMTQLNKAKELEELIKVTERGLRQIKDFIKNSKCKDNKIYKDSVYNLCISEFDDGSGYKAYLPRYLGNEEILSLIEKTLEQQLRNYKATFDSL